MPRTSAKARAEFDVIHGRESWPSCFMRVQQIPRRKIAWRSSGAAQTAASTLRLGSRVRGSDPEPRRVRQRHRWRIARRDDGTQTKIGGTAHQACDRNVAAKARVSIGVQVALGPAEAVARYLPSGQDGNECHSSGVLEVTFVRRRIARTELPNQHSSPTCSETPSMMFCVMSSSIVTAATKRPPPELWAWGRIRRTKEVIRRANESRS